MASNLKNKQYTICLEELALEAIIGILPSEREKKQRILINAEFVCTWNPTFYFDDANSKYQWFLKNCDSLESQEFLDYRILRDFIKESFAHQFGLLEEAQSYFYHQIPLRFPQIQAFWIQITKPEIFEDCKISIKINYQK